MDKRLCPYCMSETVKPDGMCAKCGRSAAEYAPHPRHLPPGWMLAGRYSLGRVLGEGGFGITYLGKDTLLEVNVAIKEFFPSQLISRGHGSSEVVRHIGVDSLFEKGLERFLQEARILAKMEKLKEIVGVSGYFQENGTAYIVMEFVDGVTFTELLDRHGGNLPAEKLFGWVEPLLTALEKMHSLGLIHRDISPDNLMLEDGAVRLLDMGSARGSLEDDEKTATVLLKRGYAPIEQYLGREQGPWTDVYALCATLYFCLTGRQPPASLDRLAGEKLPPPRALGVDITPQQERALLRGMAIKPKRRFQSIEALHRALYSMPVPLRQRKKRGLPGVLGAAALLLTASAVFLLPKPKTPAHVSPRSEGRADRTELNFQTWLESNGEDSVTIQEGTRLIATKPMTITKPVHIQPGAALSLAGCTTVIGDGRLEIEGELRVETLLQLTGGGSAHVAAGGTLAVNGYCWLEEESALAVDEGGTQNANPHFFVVNEETVFKDAVHVSSFSEYREALSNGRGKAVVIDADMEIPGFGETHQAPVLISEGVTVTGAIQGDKASSWNVDGTLLINRGTIQADLKMNDWSGREKPVTIINYGRTEGRNYLEGKGVFLNLGEMRNTAMYTWETELCNVGAIQNSRSENEGGMNISAGCAFYNGGVCYSEGIGGAPAPVAIEQGGRLFNSGQMIFGNMGWLTNEVGAEIISVGSMRFENDSQMANLGLFYNAGGTIELPLDEKGQPREGAVIGELPTEGDYWRSGR